MTEIIPAVLPKSFDDLREHLERLQGAVKQVQVDIVDGHFAHNKTWPYKDSATFEKVLSEEHGLPLWETFDFEFDLMVSDPVERVMDYVHAGASRIIVHIKAEGAAAALQKLADLKSDDYGDYSIKTGVALMCDMQPDILNDLDGLYDFVQVMGIARVGHQGEPFDKRAIYLVERLRARWPHMHVQVDGGVSIENARVLAHAGSERLIVGSAIFTAEDPVAALETLKKEANKV